jgi:site-specific DNA-methyltransferase (adenine-specific)
MDEQSGILKSGAMDSITKGGQFNVYGKMTERRVVNPPSEGGASRFFYVAKASKSERNKGLEGFEEKLPNTNDFTNLPSSRSNSINTSSGKERVVLPNQNFHPTVKPVKLMQYLVRLVTPPNGKVLDPFCGSGTTGIACKIEGFEFVGMEQDPEYTKIAEARIKNWEEEKEEKTHIIIQNIDTPIMIQQQTLF